MLYLDAIMQSAIHRCVTLALAVDVLRYIDVSTERGHTYVIHRCVTQMLYIKVMHRSDIVASGSY